MVVQHNLVAGLQALGRRPVQRLGVAGLLRHTAHPVVPCQAQALTFAGAQLEHRLGAGGKKASAFHRIGLAVDQGIKGLANQLVHLAGAGVGHDPGVGRDTRVGRVDRLNGAQVVVGLDAIQKQNARFGKVIGRLHDGVPQLLRGQRAVDPLAVGALVGALAVVFGVGFGGVHQLPGGALLHRFNKCVGHPHRHIEVVPTPRRAFGGDELQHVGVVDAQHAHLGASARTRAFHRGAGMVEHIDVAAGAGRGGRGALDVGALGADAREVVTHTAATAHGLGRFAQRFVNAGVAVFVDALDAVAHRLHKAVDQRGLDASAGRAHDAARADRARIEVAAEFGFVFGAQLGLLHAGQGPRHPVVERFDAGLAVLEVFLAQHIGADGLGRERRCGAGEQLGVNGFVHGGWCRGLVAVGPSAAGLRGKKGVDSLSKTGQV